MADVQTLPPPQYTSLTSRRQEVEYVVLAEAEGTAETSLHDYLRLLWHRKWLVLLPVLCIMPWIGLSVATQPPRYSATAVVLIEDTNPKILAIPEVAVAPEKSPNFYSTQYEIIKSRAIAEEVVDKLHLDTPRAGCHRSSADGDAASHQSISGPRVASGARAASRLLTVR